MTEKNAVNNEQFIKPTQKWVDALVVGLNLCPFAKRELVKDRVRFKVTHANNQEALLADLLTELELLNENYDIETTLLIHPNILQDFFEYNQFLSDADDLLIRLHLEGIYQIASFHPNYLFGGTTEEDAENYTNRSPFPMLHLIRETSLERAIQNYPNVDQIPEDNISLMNKLGRLKLQTLLQDCYSDVEK